MHARIATPPLRVQSARLSSSDRTMNMLTVAYSDGGDMNDRTALRLARRSAAGAIGFGVGFG